MSDEELLRHLSKVAQDVWPEWCLRVCVNGAGHAAVVTSGGTELVSIKHRHGRHVLLSALQALADETTGRSLERAGTARATGGEVVICSAIRLSDGRIFRGHRHSDCIRTAHDLVEYQEPGSWDAKHRRHEQGFVTSRNRYVGREEGLRLQKAAGIPSACPSGYRARDLFSEDLY